MINSIVIKDLAIECIIGIHPWERTTPQQILLDIRAFFDFKDVFETRSIKDTVDYVKVSQLVEEIVKKGQYKLLESMASDISAALFERFPLTSLEIEFKKPTPDVPNARYVGITFRSINRKPLSLRERANFLDASSQKTLHQGKVALITGSAKGLGKAFAEHMGSLGCKIAVHYRESQKEAQQLVETLKEHKVQAKAFQGELSNSSEMKSLVKNVYAEFERIDYLINNVGAYSSKLLSEVTPEEFSRIIQTNICGTFYLIHEVLPNMRKNKFGRIINIGQTHCESIRAVPHETAYQISKTGILMLTKTVAQMEAANGITCNMISPGIMVNNTYFPPGTYDKIPMGRLAEFQDLLGTLDFLLSPQADYITGTAIDVAGGYGL